MAPTWAIARTVLGVRGMVSLGRPTWVRLGRALEYQKVAVSLDSAWVTLVRARCQDQLYLGPACWGDLTDSLKRPVLQPQGVAHRRSRLRSNLCDRPLHEEFFKTGRMTGV